MEGEAVSGSSGSDACVAYLATTDGLIAVNVDGDVTRQDLAGSAVVSVAARGAHLAIAVAEGGVRRRRGDDWVPLGLADAHVWTVALDTTGDVYAGTEPAALWRLGGAGGPTELTGLREVEGYAKWDSPWGAADLPSIVIDEPRIIVGVEVGGVAVSHDGGATWEARNTGLYDDVHRVVADGRALYATTGMGFHRSGNEGRSWVFESDGIDRAYTQGLVFTRGAVIAAASSGPPPMWESGGPEAAIFRADAGDDALRWSVVMEGFAGNVDRQALAAAGDLVIAGTTAGEVLVSRDAGRTFEIVATDLPAITAVAVADA